MCAIITVHSECVYIHICIQYILIIFNPLYILSLPYPCPFPFPYLQALFPIRILFLLNTHKICISIKWLPTQYSDMPKIYSWYVKHFTGSHQSLQSKFWSITVTQKERNSIILSNKHFVNSVFCHFQSGNEFYQLLLVIQIRTH